LTASSLDRHLGEEILLRRGSLVVFGMVLILVIGAGIITCRVDEAFRDPRSAVQYDETQDLDLMYRTYVAPLQLDAFAKIVGTKPSTYFAAPQPVDGVFRARLIDGAGTVELRRENPRCISISSDCRGNARLLLTQLYFPLWKKISSDDTSPDAGVGVSPEGLLEVPIASGSKRFQLVFDGGAPERWGRRITIASLLFSLIGYPFSAVRAKAGRHE
jgi:hypothetical protein